MPHTWSNLTFSCEPPGRPNSLECDWLNLKWVLFKIENAVGSDRVLKQSRIATGENYFQIENMVPSSSQFHETNSTGRVVPSKCEQDHIVLTSLITVYSSDLELQ